MYDHDQLTGVPREEGAYIAISRANRENRCSVSLT
jgi:hypothetical protein